MRHSGHGPTCEPCESKKDEYREAPPKGKSSSQKEESSGGRNPSGSSHYDEDRGDTTDRMKATLMDIGGATGPTTLAMKATLVMTMGMTSKAMVEVMAAMTLGSKGTIAGAKDMDGRTGLHVRGITGLTMSVPMGGNSATASNLVKSGTAASSHSRLTTSWPYKRSSHKTRSRVLKRVDVCSAWALDRLRINKLAVEVGHP